MTLTIYFIIACSAVIYSGIKLTEKGDQLEDVVGISAGFVGTFLLAMTTSLPEFVATFSSIYRLDAPQLALGNIFGSNTFNLAILAVLDLFFIKECLYHKVHHYVIKALAVGQLMTGLALFGIFMNGPGYTLTYNLSGKSLLTINIFILAVLIVYALTINTATSNDESEDGDEDQTEEESTLGSKKDQRTN